MRLRTLLCSLALLAGAAALLPSVGDAQVNIPNNNKKCTPAAPTPPAGFPCLIACTTQTIQCGGGAPVIGTHTDGFCTSQQNAGCKLFNRPMHNPVFQCKLKRCKLPNNQQGNECVWEHTGYDMNGNAVGHTDCIGFI